MGTRTEQEPEPVYIALGAPLTGAWSIHGTAILRGAQIAVAEINADGGLLGRPLELLVGDTEGDPKVATDLARGWSADESVVAQIGGFASAPTLAAQRIYHAAGIVQVSPAVGHPAFAAGSPWSFSMVGLSEGEGASNARYAFRELDSRRAAIIYHDGEWGRRISREFEEEFARLGGSVVARAFYFASEPLYEDILESVRQSNPDLLYLVAKETDGAAICRLRGELGWQSVVILGPSRLHSESFLRKAGSQADGVVTSAHFLPHLPDSPARHFHDAYRSRFDSDPGLVAALAYDAIHLIEKSAQTAGGVSRRGLREALAGIGPHHGATGELHFSAEGNAMRQYAHLVVSDGAFTER